MADAPPWKKNKTELTPPDFEGCAVVTCLWGQKVNILVDTLVLGNSLVVKHCKGRRISSVNKGTMELPEHLWLQKFWIIHPVDSMDLSDKLQGTEQ